VIASIMGLPDTPKVSLGETMVSSDLANDSEPMTAPTLVVDDFMPGDAAMAMRADVEAHFADPDRHRPETHQVWNYWFVPGLYTYLRTQPEKIIARAKVEQFCNRLRSWSVDRLGLAGLSWPYLSLYVSGCGQGFHNDARGGRFGFVYSLTPVERDTIGGETMVFHEGDLFRRNLRTANAGQGLYELIEPRFNRLVLFDDRLIHGVQRVGGSMDPREARCVMHGHIEESGPIIVGVLSKDASRESIQQAIERFATGRTDLIQHYHGPIVLRFTVSPAGKVIRSRPLLDRVVHERNGYEGWEPLKTALIEAVNEAVFPAAAGETTITLPVTFGGSIPSSQGQ
jgi:hypothetical protein